MAAFPGGFQSLGSINSKQIWTANDRATTDSHVGLHPTLQDANSCDNFLANMVAEVEAAAWFTWDQPLTDKKICTCGYRKNKHIFKAMWLEHKSKIAKRWRRGWGEGEGLKMALKLAQMLNPN